MTRKCCKCWWTKFTCKSPISSQKRFFNFSPIFPPTNSTKPFSCRTEKSTKPFLDSLSHKKFSIRAIYWPSCTTWFTGMPLVSSFIKEKMLLRYSKILIGKSIKIGIELNLFLMDLCKCWPVTHKFLIKIDLLYQLSSFDILISFI